MDCSPPLLRITCSYEPVLMVPKQWSHFCGEVNISILQTLAGKANIFQLQRTPEECQGRVKGSTYGICAN